MLRLLVLTVSASLAMAASVNLTKSWFDGLGSDDDQCAMRGGECHSSSCPSQFTMYSRNYCGWGQICCLKPRDTADDSCTDTREHCPVWAQYGMCKNDPKWMADHCRKSCGQCGSAAKPTHAPSTGSSSNGQCGISPNEEAHNDRIVGGTKASPAEYPWQVTLLFRGQHMCGGTLISDRHVVTAAHCFQGPLADRRQWLVGVGLTSLEHVTRNNVVRVAKVSVHERYVHEPPTNDIALLTLAQPLRINQGELVRTACLPQKGEDFEGQTCTITGWGSMYEGGPATKHLQEVDLPVISNAQCSNVLGAQAGIQKGVICAGVPQGGHDACQGDSGGPMVCKKGGVWQLAGIVSWGYGCAHRMVPGVYTRVSEYVDWIHAHQ